MVSKQVFTIRRHRLGMSAHPYWFGVLLDCTQRIPATGDFAVDAMPGVSCDGRQHSIQRKSSR